MKKITEDDEKRIIDLYFNEKLNFVEISNKTGISRGTVSNIINEHKKITGKDVKSAKIVYANVKKKVKSYHTNLVNLPSSFLEGIGINTKKKESGIDIFLDKNKKEIKIKKGNNN